MNASAEPSLASAEPSLASAFALAPMMLVVVWLLSF